MKTIFINSLKCILSLSLVMLLQFIFLSRAESRSDHTFHFFGGMNPVGSGARSLGFGGAFIGVCDDATASVWNPGGTIQLEYSEISIVFEHEKRTIDMNFSETHAASGHYPIQLDNLNFASASYKSRWRQRDFVLSLSYQMMYDLNKKENATYPLHNILIHNFKKNTGNIKAVTPSFAFQLTPEISLGVSMNLYSDDWGCHWKTSVERITESITDNSLWQKSQYKNTYQFNGKNFHIGLLIALTQNLNLGLVYKTPYFADIYFNEQFQVNGNQNAPLKLYPEEQLALRMPQSYGFGISWRPDYPNLRDSLTLALDIYRTDWQHYYIRHADGYEENLYASLPRSQCDETRPTYQVRAGVEYWLFNVFGNVSVPVRFGAFYDPEPTASTPDDFRGISLGTGVLKGRVALDIAWQFRWGNQVRKKQFFMNEDVFQDVRQHTLYCSMIYYFAHMK